jgi:exopolysaccharide biosynthesis polyprenyl glycosylphosphotransferase
MIRERLIGLSIIKSLIGGGLVQLSYWIWVLLFQALDVVGAFRVDKYLIYSAVIAGTVIAWDLYHARIAPDQINNSVAESAKTAFSESMWIFSVLTIFLVSNKDIAISRKFLFSWMVVCFTILFFGDLWLSGIIASKAFRFSRISKAVIIGGGDNFVMFEKIRHQRLMGIEILGWVGFHSESWAHESLPHLGTINDLEAISQKFQVDQILVWDLMRFCQNINSILQVCEKYKIRLNLEAEAGFCDRYLIRKITDSNYQFVKIVAEPLESPFNRLIKRVVDLIISSFVVIFVLPFLTILVWFLQRRQSPGPVFYQQPRDGLNNNPFGILKFRTMNVNNDSTARQATQFDQRVFSSGKWMRRFSIDEIPQFVNVFRGEMSVVGPRPHLNEHNNQWSKLMANYSTRCYVKPGITGLAQIRGYRGEAKSDQDIRCRVASDIEYIEGWSMGLDLFIIMKTLFHMLFPPRTAY